MVKCHSIKINEFLNGEIIPGEKVGKIHLGWSVEILEAYLKEIEIKYEVEDRANCEVIVTEYAKFWIGEKSKAIEQIMVGGDYKGTFRGEIGVGTRKVELSEEFKDWKEDLTVYIISQYPGMCFELKDVSDYDDEWDENDAPIQYISVFIPN